MNWLLDRRDRSVASSAQRVVQDMHKDLEYHKTRVGELERTVVQLQEIATKSLQEELFRLEMRGKEILLELEETDPRQQLRTGQDRRFPARPWQGRPPTLLAIRRAPQQGPPNGQRLSGCPALLGLSARGNP